jgi:hypothetical protein
MSLQGNDFVIPTRTQELVRATGSGFKSPLPHQQNRQSSGTPASAALEKIRLQSDKRARRSGLFVASRVLTGLYLLLLVALVIARGGWPLPPLDATPRAGRTVTIAATPGGYVVTRFEFNEETRIVVRQRASADRVKAAFEDAFAGRLDRFAPLDARLVQIARDDAH